MQTRHAVAVLLVLVTVATLGMATARNGEAWPPLVLLSTEEPVLAHEESTLTFLTLLLDDPVYSIVVVYLNAPACAAADALKEEPDTSEGGRFSWTWTPRTDRDQDAVAIVTARWADGTYLRRFFEFRIE